MEKHAEASQGRYYVYCLTLTSVAYRGPFYPANRTERVRIFVEQTGNLDGKWYGAYYRRLPQAVRDAIEEDARSGQAHA